MRTQTQPQNTRPLLKRKQEADDDPALGGSAAQRAPVLAGVTNCSSARGGIHHRGIWQPTRPR